MLGLSTWHHSFRCCLPTPPDRCHKKLNLSLTFLRTPGIPVRVFHCLHPAIKVTIIKEKVKAGEHMAYRVAIVDDSATDAEFVQGILNSWAEQRLIDIRAEVFTTAEAFLFRYAEDKEWDILLLDIEMGAMDGVTMAKRVRQSNEAVQIVFITGYSDYIAEGYEVAALHYLMKPVNQEKLMTVLDRAIEKRKQEERCLNLEAYGEMVRLPFYEIRYLDVKANYVTVHAKADYTVKRTLGDFEKELDDRFCRVGRGMILNLKYIQRVTKTEVRLSDGTVFPLPRGAYEPLNRAIISHT